MTLPALTPPPPPPPPHPHQEPRAAAGLERGWEEAHVAGINNSLGGGEWGGVPPAPKFKVSCEQAYHPLAPPRQVFAGKEFLSKCVLELQHGISCQTRNLFPRDKTQPGGGAAHPLARLPADVEPPEGRAGARAGMGRLRVGPWGRGCGGGRGWGGGGTSTAGKPQPVSGMACPWGWTDIPAAPRFSVPMRLRSLLRP